MKDFYLYLTDRAIEEFKSKLEHRKTPNARVRVGIRGGGCSGFQYFMQFEDTLPRKDKDMELFYYGICVIVDIRSATYLNGCTLDWKETLMKKGFEFINPNADKFCGCGESFTV